MAEQALQAPVMKAETSDAQDAKLRELLAELFKIANEKGPDSKEVQALVSKNITIPDFKELAATLLLMIANH